MHRIVWTSFILFSGFVLSVRRDDLLPFGEEHGDQRLPIGDDENSPEFELQTPIAFYDYRYRSVFINTNGVISFEREYPTYYGDLYFPVGVKVIAPFLADVDTRLSGNVFYRETMDPGLLGLVTSAVHDNFPNSLQFRASDLLIVTWHDVGSYRQQYDKINTFQVAVASDGFDSYVAFMYEDKGLQWVTGEGKNSPYRPDQPAHAGFDSGDLVRYHTLPGSGQYDVDQLATSSNMGRPGMWLFHVGLIDTRIVEPTPRPDVTDDNRVDPGSPDSGRYPDTGYPDTGYPDTGYPDTGYPDYDRRPAGPTSCAAGGAYECHESASCRDEYGGFCCECRSPAVGNGYSCMETGGAMRLNGKVSGSVNNYYIQSQDMHAFIVTNEGRAYTAISRLPQEVGLAMQAAYPVASLIGWLFAATESPEAKNGVMLTGGTLNSTSIMRFDSGEVLTITQNFTNDGNQDSLNVLTQLEGEMPRAFQGQDVRLDDYTEVFTKERAGVMRASSQHAYQMGDRPHTFTLEQTIMYKEACSQGVQTSSEGITMQVERPFITYGAEEEIVRYAAKNSVSVGGSGPIPQNPCESPSTSCDVNALCTPQGGKRYTCDCKSGFQGDGYVCNDIDECYYASHDCDINAQCYNSEGAFECRCLPGYTGDGKSCQRDMTCADLICHAQASCVYDYDRRQAVCQCQSGFIGDGLYCEAIEFGCNEVNNCHENADCMYDQRSRKYQCECMDGFSGDGVYCTDSGEAEISCRSCDRNAKCQYDVGRMHFHCACVEGYTGDGYTCSEIASESCLVLNNCDYNARCIRGICQCNPGFRGDGYRCEADTPLPGGNTCEVAEDCHPDANCAYSPQYDEYVCQCNPGFSGDGIYCAEEDCSTNNYCDINAQCSYEVYSQRYSCRCNPGYEGDGRYCRQEGDCSRDPNLCDEHASCMRRGNVFVCACDQGYQGDGRRCAPMGDSASYIIYAQGMTIMQIPFQPTDDDLGTRLLDLEGQTAIGLDVDCYARNLYWTDIAGKTINRAALDGSDQKVLVSDVGSPEGVAIDWISQNMYWTDSVHDVIEVSHLDGTHRTSIIKEGLVNPRAITVDPGYGLVFWSDWNRDAPKIESAYMDGTNRETLVADDLGLPNGLALDQAAQQLCWADAGTQHVECISYDGRGRRVVYAFASYPFDVVFANDVFYWTDWDMSSLSNIDKYGGDTNSPLVLPDGGNGRLYGITAVRERCPAVTNACALNNGGCRFLCLPTPNGGRSCVCPDDIDESECNELGLVV